MKKQQDLSVSVLARSSTLYHSLFLYPMAGRVLQVLDHAAIYLLIAGTYTPFLLFYSDTWQFKRSEKLDLGGVWWHGIVKGQDLRGSGSGPLKGLRALTQLRNLRHPSGCVVCYVFCFGLLIDFVQEPSLLDPTSA